MKYILWLTLILLIVYSCFSVAYDALKKNHFKKDIHISFYKNGGLARTTHGTRDILANKKIADKIMKEGWDYYEVDN